MFQEQDGWYNDDFYQTQYRILQSRTLARRTVELMNLPAHPSLHGLPAADDAAQRDGAAVGCLTTGRRQDAQRAGARRCAAKVAAARRTRTGSRPTPDMVLGSLTVAPVRNSRLVELRFTSTDPQLAADMANAHWRRPTSSRTSSSSSPRRRTPPTGWASGWPSSEEGRAERGGAAAVPSEAARRGRRRGSPEHRRAAAGGPERGGHAGEDGADREGSALQPAQAVAGHAGASTPSRRSCRTTTSRS